MSQIKYTEPERAIEIGLPFIPSKNLSVYSFPATKIKISYGGGLGGSVNNIYAQKIKEIEKYGQKFVHITPFFGEPEEINPRFIVSIEEGQVVIQVTDTTEFSNYHEKKCEYSELTRFFYLRKNVRYKLIEKTLVHQKNELIHQFSKIK